MTVTSTYEVRDEAEYDALIDRLNNMFADKWCVTNIEHEYKRKKWWHLFPSIVLTKVTVEFDV